MKEILYKLTNHEHLSRESAREVLLRIADGEYNDSQLSAFMMAFLMRSITTTELAGFRDALLERKANITLDADDAIDIVGTGGDGKSTFNISTTVCFVLAGAGYRVVKHGNYAATSVSGASNVLEYLGAKFTTDSSKLQKSLDTIGFAYLHAPLFSPALKSVGPARKAIGVRTFFNILGPLVNPIRPKHQLLGVYSLPLLRLYNYIAQEENTKCTIVHSLDGYDEISLTAPFKVANAMGENIYTPESLNLTRVKESDLYGGETVKTASEILCNVLLNKSSEAQENCVLANSAFAIMTLDPNKKFDEAFNISKESLRQGEAYKVLTQYLALNS